MASPDTTTRGRGFVSRMMSNGDLGLLFRPPPAHHREDPVKPGPFIQLERGRIPLEKRVLDSCISCPGMEDAGPMLVAKFLQGQPEDQDAFICALAKSILEQGRDRGSRGSENIERCCRRFLERVPGEKKIEHAEINKIFQSGPYAFFDRLQKLFANVYKQQFIPLYIGEQNLFANVCKQQFVPLFIGEQNLSALRAYLVTAHARQANFAFVSIDENGNLPEAVSIFQRKGDVFVSSRIRLKDVDATNGAKYLHVDLFGSYVKASREIVGYTARAFQTHSFCYARGHQNSFKTD